MKGFVQEKSGKYYLVLDLYDERGRRRPKWISTGLPVRGNKRKAEAMLDDVLARYEETGELPTGRSHAYQITPPGCKPREQNVLTKADMPFLDYLEEWLLQRRSVIQPATYISYSSIVPGRVRDFFKPLNVTFGGVTPQMLDEFHSQILAERGRTEIGARERGHKREQCGLIYRQGSNPSPKPCKKSPHRPARGPLYGASGI